MNTPKPPITDPVYPSEPSPTVPPREPLTPDPYPVTDPVVPEPAPHPEPEPIPGPPEPIPQYPPDVTFNSVP
jgi:hypothetical protein